MVLVVFPFYVAIRHAINHAHLEKSRLSTRVSSPRPGPTSVSAVDRTDDRWDDDSVAFDRKFATEDLRRLLRLSRTFLVSLDAPFDVPGGDAGVEPACFGPYRSRIRLISRSLFRHDETCSPPSLFAHTCEKTDALSASKRMNPGRAVKLTILVSAAGEISGKPGLLITCTL